MRPFACTCGQPLFFDNLRCLGCGAEVGFDLASGRLGPIESLANRRVCAHRGTEAACNWMLSADDAGTMCASCRTTRAIPDLARPRNAERLRALESAKRRALLDLHAVGLPIVARSDVPPGGLAFDFLETLEGARPVMTGHAGGVITLNIAEADDDYRERNRESLKEPYRTVLGHLRHELGHYYWDVLVRDGPWLEPYRALFGDERADYGAALQRHYAEGPPPDWQIGFISSYAASHPWEDWAESWAHYLHIRSTLETVAGYGLETASAALRVTPFGPEALHVRSTDAASTAFLAWINAWVVLTTVLNETARSMGQPDIYPFVMNVSNVRKLHFIHRVVTNDDVG
jgi:hypothetical protein